MIPGRDRVRLGRLVFLLPAGAAFALGAWGGLLRLSWALPLWTAALTHHAPLMVGGFLGTLIGVERAVADGRSAAYAGPLLTGLGALALVAGLPGARLVMLAGSVGYLAVVALPLARPEHRQIHAAVGAAAAIAWVVGTAVWAAGHPVAVAAPWWMVFLVLTVVAERLELSRLARPSRGAVRLFLVSCAALFVGAALPGPVGVRLRGASLLALALWLGRHDIARRTVRASGQYRYVAVGVLSGTFWLGIAGILRVVYGDATGPPRDAALHAVFVGFLFSMILAHGPIVAPAVLGFGVRFGRALYLPLAVLQASVGLRIAGDLLALGPARRLAGIGHIAALVLFALMLLGHGEE